MPARFRADDIDTLARDLERFGARSQHDRLAAVATAAAAAGAPGVLVAVVGGADEPEPARLRAFGRLASWLAAAAADRARLEACA
jgi:hypothetical protein